MKPYQQRVVDEKAELDSKLDKLNAFFPTDLFAQLKPNEQERLYLQASVMQKYSNILGERIEDFV